jgi:FixJ family two-component response regulator
MICQQKRPAPARDVGADLQRGGIVALVAIIDDDIDVLASLKFLLEVAGHEVATYHSPVDFLARAGSPADCLIVDQHMPQMTGLELVGRLRLRPSPNNIMLITGSLSPAIVEQAGMLGIAIVVEKPPANDRLLAFVARSTPPR